MAEMSSSSAEQAVTSMFAGVTRAAVAHAGDSPPHLNVGEVLSSGVTTILRELGDVNARDVFFDIGAGLGNVVAQVVLATKVHRKRSGSSSVAVLDPDHSNSKVGRGCRRSWNHSIHGFSGGEGGGETRNCSHYSNEQDKTGAHGG
ncbi:hypothetical protein PC128_g15206 [Phytophthora cactorum]|uniref:DOT1 domain-containing protein n=1 Tax=Phytophthora cactorum TaxID=29920 RepID=A0A8T1DMX8_9STRA|nr:hypothetical protein PC117_g9968 [Phytophthora cactorum]KAG3181344.1 hypothetical protein PC128_g15206 [Phytophthora cactorum]